MNRDHDKPAVELAKLPDWVTVSTSAASTDVGPAHGPFGPAHGPYRSATSDPGVVARWRHDDELGLRRHGFPLRAVIIAGAILVAMIVHRPVGIAFAALVLVARWLSRITSGRTELRLERTRIVRSTWSPSIVPFRRERPRPRAQASMGYAAVVLEHDPTAVPTEVFEWPATLVTRIDRRSQRDVRGRGDQVVTFIVWLGDGNGKQEQLLVTPDIQLAAGVCALVLRHQPARGSGV